MTTDYNTDHAAISASAIKRAILRRGQTADDCELSMLHMRHEMTRPRIDDGTPAMRWGTVCHAAIMEPQRLAIWTGDRKAGKWWQAFAEDNADRIVVTTPEHCRAMAVRDAVMGNKRAAAIVRDTLHELPLQWQDPAMGACKGRPDMARAALPCSMIADLKLLRDASATAINAAIYRAGTDLQMAWYRRGLRAIDAAAGNVLCVVVVVESAPPHACVVVDMPPQYIDAAEQLAVEIARRYRVYEACQSFPGPTSGEMTYEPPTWAQSDDVRIDDEP